MILVDTSIWVDHLRGGDAHLAELLAQNKVVTHEAIIGEIACGHLKHRAEVLALLGWLPRCGSTSHDETLFFIEQHELMGKGIGYIDACLLAACKLSGIRLWTRDKRLDIVATGLDCSYQPNASH